LFFAGCLGVAVWRGCEMKKDRDYLNNLPTVRYVIQKGDRVYNIADDFLKPKTANNYSQETIVDRVQELNPGVDLTRVQPGDEILLPTEELAPEGAGYE
jgi:hypothetical protein